MEAKNKQSAEPAPSDRRYHVPDLTPADRPELRGLEPRYVFVAESPHLSEVEPEASVLRRPLCGVAGRAWWTMLGELLEGDRNMDPSLDRLMGFCRDHRIAVMNAVQEPLDPKIRFRYPEAEPTRNLGFAKTSGEFGYKKKKGSPEVRRAVASLRKRLNHPALKGAEIHCLGLDAEWFVQQALGKEEFARRTGERIPHPSAWWRREGWFGRVAREKLTRIFEPRLNLLSA